MDQIRLHAACGRPADGIQGPGDFDQVAGRVGLLAGDVCGAALKVADDV